MRLAPVLCAASFALMMGCSSDPPPDGSTIAKNQTKSSEAGHVENGPWEIPKDHVWLPEGCGFLGERPECDYFFPPPRTDGKGVRKAGQTKILFLNFEGAHLESGNDNPSEGKSSLLSMLGVGQVDMPAFQDASYSRPAGLSSRQDLIYAITGYVRYYFAPFGIDVVFERPPPTQTYGMVMVSGSASLVGEPYGVLGVSPLDCNDSDPRTICFAFAEELTNPLGLALVIVHEAGHALGLSHVDDPGGIMYPSASGYDVYWSSGGVPDGQACDGTFAQDSFQVLLDNLGSRSLLADPWLELVWPTNGTVLESLAEAVVQTSDDVMVETLELLVDGTSLAIQSWPEMKFALPVLDQGEHTLTIRGQDPEDHQGQKREYETSVTFTVDMSCGRKGDCAAPRKAVGQACQSGRDCQTGICVEDPSTNARLCSRECSLQSPCPWPMGLALFNVAAMTECVCDIDDPMCCSPQPEDCSDGLDNDCDGRIDCADPDCTSSPYCTGMEVCNNGVDDDLDGATDCSDPDCRTKSECGCLPVLEDCTDGQDNDCNGLVDCADPSCLGQASCGSGPTERPRYCSASNGSVRVLTSSSTYGLKRKLSGCQAAQKPCSSSPLLFLFFAGLLFLGRKLFRNG